jgi:hypothetical protein
MNRTGSRPYATTDLTIRVCNKGHVGNWVVRKDGSQRAYRLRQGRKPRATTSKLTIEELYRRRNLMLDELAKVAVEIVKLEIEVGK